MMNTIFYHDNPKISGKVVGLTSESYNFYESTES